MEITIKEGGVEVTIKTEQDGLDIFDIWAGLIRPALLGLGYAEETVDQLVKEEIWQK